MTPTANEITVTLGTGIDNSNLSATAGILFTKMLALTASRALETDGSGFIVASAITQVELSRLSGVSANIQTQLNGKLTTTSNDGAGEGLAKAIVGTDAPFKSLIGETLKIILTGNANDVTLTLGTDVVTIDKANTFGDFNQIFQINRLRIRSSGAGNYIIGTPAGVGSDITISFPAVAISQQFVLRTVLQTLEGKTYNVQDNTLIDNTNNLGDLLKNNGTKFVRFARGTLGQFLRVTATDIEYDSPEFTKGGTVLDPDVRNIITWRAPFACTVTNVRGYRVGGTGATINARLNGSSTHLSSDLSLTSVDTWQDGGGVQNTAYVAGDKLEIMIVTLAGSPSQIAVQVDFTIP